MLARLIDVSVAVVPSAWFTLTAARRRSEHGLTSPLESAVSARRTVIVAGLAVDALMGCGWSPGTRIARVRPVLVRDGSHIGFRRALVRELIMQPQRVLMRTVARPFSADQERRARLIRTAMEQGGASSVQLPPDALDGRAFAAKMLRTLAASFVLDRVFARLRDSLTGESVLVET